MNQPNPVRADAGPVPAVRVMLADDSLLSQGASARAYEPQGPIRDLSGPGSVIRVPG